jgi:hypothetical protein
MRSIGGVVGAQAGAALLTAYKVPGTHGLPALHGFIVTFAIAAGASLVAAVLAVLTPEPSRRERLKLLAGEV